MGSTSLKYEEVKGMRRDLRVQEGASHNFNQCDGC